MNVPGPQEIPDSRTVPDHMRLYTEIPYVSLEERPEGFILTLGSGRRVGFWHAEKYHHDPKRQVLGVPRWAAIRKGLAF